MVDGGERPEAVDARAVMAEVREEVRRRRLSGDLPPTLERDLDMLFAQFAPLGTSTDDYERVLERAEQTAFIDGLVPIDSLRPGGAAIKRTIRELVGWYVRYVVQQINGFTDASTRSLRLLHDRVTALERTHASLDDLVTREPDGWAWVGPTWGDEVAKTLPAARGRVLHADCGDGALVRALGDGGIDAYGVDPRDPLVAVGADRGLDVRPGGALDHLERVPERELRAVVLSRCVDRLGNGDKVSLIDHAVTRLNNGGALVVITTDPASWPGEAGVIEADVAPSRPVAASTWAALLRRRVSDVVTAERQTTAGTVTHLFRGVRKPTL